ncbi:DUF2189 domain-containing protein [Sphingomonas donggukensis]|uniref:DUF2189 domain-containing protein n=1 Tax=Sphingomonas donggukensis TaxID=2949093 RepID=A0ABY4TWU3_9SPHN|nr:DUF2189 domain-containing protein [Sphingomonas donggukensis]URW74773.1 DUF2189 domain-containing protein [Sphingomonas donggukensis]
MPTRDTFAPTHAPAAAGLPDIRRIGPNDLRWALAEGWKDFRAKRGDLLFLGLLYPLICLAAAMVTFKDPLLPLFFPLVAGLSIAGPAVASGFYELARRREEGRDASWWHFLDPLNGRSRTPLLALTGGLAVLFLGWLIVAYAIYGVTLGTQAPRGISGFVEQLFTTPEGWMMIVIGNLAGAAFAVVTLIFSLVSFPMVVDKPVDAGLAVRTSIAAVRRNPREAFGWGLRVAGLLLLGLLPAAIGLAVVLPWLGYATWHLYTRIVAR